MRYPENCPKFVSLKPCVRENKDSAQPCVRVREGFNLGKKTYSISL
jgi:hypothetical protein